MLNISIDWLFNCSRLSDFQFETLRSSFCIKKVFSLLFIIGSLILHHKISLFRIMLMWLVLLYALRVAHGSETCQNYPNGVQLSSFRRFREGDWFDQVRVYSGSHDYVSQFHPNDTVSMFLAKYHTNCGYFELKTLSADAFEFNKGHYVARFREHFYPFRSVITRNYSDLSCRISLERSRCKSYVNLTGAVYKINVLMTDYSSYMILHQCIDNKNYIMMLTEKKRIHLKDKIGLNDILIDIMTDYKIHIDNQTFWWPTTDKCHEYNLGMVHKTCL